MAEDKYDHVNHSKKTIFSNNFIGGIAWGLGATLGLAIFFAIIAFIGSHINFVPIVGNFVSEVANYILSTRPM